MTSPQRLPVEQDIDPSIFEAIGVLIATSSLAEAAIGKQLLRLVGHAEHAPAKAWIIIAGMEFRPKIHMINALAAIVTPSHVKSIQDCCQKIEDSMSKRHRLAHDLITAGRKISEIRLIQTRYKTGQQAVYWTATQIRGYAREIHRRVRALDDVLTDAGIQPLPKYPEPDRRGTKTPKPRPTRKRR